MSDEVKISNEGICGDRSPTFGQGPQAICRLGYGHASAWHEDDSEPSPQRWTYGWTNAPSAALSAPSEPTAKVNELIAESSLGAALRAIDGEAITVEWLKHCGWQDADIELAFAERDHGECDATPEGWDCSDADGYPLHPLHDEVDDIAALVMFVLEKVPAAPSEPVPDGPRVWASPEPVTIPEDVSVVADRGGCRWERVGGLWRAPGDVEGDAFTRTAQFTWCTERNLLQSRGPLTEVVEEATP